MRQILNCADFKRFEIIIDEKELNNNIDIMLVKYHELQDYFSTNIYSNS